LKAAFIAFLAQQPLFKDFDFKGSNLNVILDLLSRNTFLNSYYLNMVFTESMLDSAQLRDSVVSKAKVLNYVPSSATSPVGYVNVTVSTFASNVFIIPAGTYFKGTNANGTFTYTTDRDYIQVSANNTFNFPNVAIYEGTFSNDVFIFSASTPNQLFSLSNPQIDTSSLKVLVSEEKGSQNTYFIQSEGIFDLNGNSRVYFLQGAEANCYQIQFGDNVLGYSPQDGSVITATYRLTFGDKGNGCGQFYLSDNLGAFNNTGIANITISTVANSAGGAQAEGIESIRFNAPRMYQTQDRAITANDYRNLILRRFPQVGDVNVYGGNVSASSVDFGTVYVAAVSKSGNPLPNVTKSAIISYIAPLAMVPVKDFIKIVDANTIWLNVNTNIHVDFTQTNNSVDYYKTITTNQIIGYANANLQEFGKPFVYSSLSQMINQADSNNVIIGNETQFTMKRLVNVALNTNNVVYFSYNNPISSVQSTDFIYNGSLAFITDSYANVSIPKGTLAMVTFATSNSVLSSTPVGTVNYSTGTVSIPSLVVSQYTDSCTSFSFIATTNSQVLYVKNNDIFNIDPASGIQVNVTSG
jgi:hypothetical protein